MTEVSRDAYWREIREERAAIMEYEGGLSREDAARRAGQEVQLMSLQATSERVQAHREAQGTKTKTKATEKLPKQEQFVLPGFDGAFGGG